MSGTKKIMSEGKKIKPKGFNSVDSCPNCNPCYCPINKEECNAKISRHEFMNPYEFSDKALLEELIIRIKKGCIQIEKGDETDVYTESEVDYLFVDKCRWDLSRGMKEDEKGEIVKDPEAKEDYIISLNELLGIQDEYRKLEDEKKLCDLCLYKPKRSETSQGIFCKDCWKRETRTRAESLKSIPKINKSTKTKKEGDE